MVAEYFAEVLAHVRVVDGATVTVDQPLPWGQALNFHATVHCPPTQTTSKHCSLRTAQPAIVADDQHRAASVIDW